MFAVSVCKSQRNIYLSPQLNNKIQIDENESRPKNTINDRRIPRRQTQSVMIGDAFNEQTDNEIQSSAFGMNSVRIHCNIREEIEGTNIDSLLQATVSDELPLINEDKQKKNQKSS